MSAIKAFGLPIPPPRDPAEWPPLLLFPMYLYEPLPTMEETMQQVIDDLAMRGIRLVVPGFLTPWYDRAPLGIMPGEVK